MRRALGFGAGAFALLLAWYLWRYRDATGFFFHFDDFWLLADGSRVTGWEDVLRPGRNHFVLYRPLSQVAYYWFLQFFFGYDAAPYHATQILAHVFNAFLVYGIASLVLRSRALGMGAALIYAAEPGHAISVYWNALYSMTGTVSWYLACLWLWLASGKSRGPASRLAAFALFAGALLSSEHGVTLPVALALASILILQETPRQTAVGLAPFFLVSLVYGLAKIEYMRHGLDADYADPMVRAVIRADYQPELAPLESLRLFGFFTGCALGWLYDASPAAPRWYAVGTAMLVLVAVSAWWARASAAGRRVCFGLLLFATALGPLLLLPRHPYSYYVGTAGTGLAIAIVAAAAAMPRARRLAPAIAVVAVLAGEILVGEDRAKASDEFRFWREFQVAALRWIQAVDRAAAADPRTVEVVVPKNAVTELVFEQGRSQALLLGGSYAVRLVPDIAAEQARAGVAVVGRTPMWRKGNDYPGRQARFDWLRGRDPWANG